MVETRLAIHAGLAMPTLLMCQLGCHNAVLLLQVLGEDLVLVKGQQDRMIRGADIWQHPVSYDKLAVRYRRWRNSLDSPDKAEREASKAALAKMSAGELFQIEEDCESEQCEV